MNKVREIKKDCIVLYEPVRPKGKSASDFVGEMRIFRNEVKLAKKGLIDKNGTKPSGNGRGRTGCVSKIEVW